MKVIILGRNGDWNIIDEDELEKWKRHGALQEGDLIIIPKEVFEVVERKILAFKPIKNLETLEVEEK